MKFDLQQASGRDEMLSRHKQFLHFLVAGGIAAAINFLSRIVLNAWMPYSAAIVLAYCLGMLTAFLLNRLFVFKANNPLHHQVLWFTLINVIALAQTLLISLLLARLIFPSLGWFWHSDAIAHGIGVLAPVLTSFIGHKRLSFKSV
jgi:putative flippase GtrA